MASDAYVLTVLVDSEDEIPAGEPVPLTVPRTPAARAFAEYSGGGAEPVSVQFHGPYEGFTVTEGQRISRDDWARFCEASAWACQAVTQATKEVRVG
jgi:hypothetical protein